MEGLERIVAGHRFFAGLGPEFITLVGRLRQECALRRRPVPVPRRGSRRPRFYLIRHGRVALEMAAPGRGAVTFETVGEDEIVGLSWLLPPYRWGYDARALELTRAIAMDATACATNARPITIWATSMMKRFMPVLVQRLQATRLQILDVYGPRR